MPSQTRQRGLSEFPDSVTARGARHLAELSDMVAAGHRAAMLYLVHRGDTSAFSLARDMDPEQFDWRREMYEFVSDRLAIDLLAGSDR